MVKTAMISKYLLKFFVYTIIFYLNDMNKNNALEKFNKEDIV